MYIEVKDDYRFFNVFPLYSMYYSKVGKGKHLERPFIIHISRGYLSISIFIHKKKLSLKLCDYRKPSILPTNFRASLQGFECSTDPPGAACARSLRTAALGCSAGDSDFLITASHPCSSLQATSSQS